ncbi:MAG: hypothetical protein JKY27_05705 [Magnetovibrio sp.]|nr:hypothetical protein [Magnetovibrio sp.]
MQFQFLDQVAEIAGHGTDNNHILMSSHSAATITPIQNATITLFEFDGKNVLTNPANKMDVIKSLSAGLITFSENEARISINNFIRGSDGPVLFTEGVSDEVILEIAWEKLYGDKCHFGIQNAFDHTFLRGLFSRTDLSINFPNRKMFALFDFDDAYNSWNGFKNCTPVEEDPYKGLAKQLSYEHHFAILLPVPQNATIKSQVLNEDDKAWAACGSSSSLSIELLFYGFEGMNDHFVEKSICGGGKVVSFIGNKVNFAENIISKLPAAAFKPFRPMFDLISRVRTH